MYLTLLPNMPAAALFKHVRKYDRKERVDVPLLLGEPIENDLHVLLEYVMLLMM